MLSIALPEKQVWETLLRVTQASSVMMSLPSSTNRAQDLHKKYPLYIGDAGLTTAKMHLLFWQLQLLPELQLLTRNSPYPGCRQPEETVVLGKMDKGGQNDT